MAEPAQSPQDVLRDEILADAQRQGERELRRARQEAEAVLAKAEEEVAREREATLEKARAEARRRRELLLATVAVETNRMRAAKVEALLQAVHDEAKARLSSFQGPDHREVLLTLMVEALTRMEGDHFIMGVAEPDRRALGEGWVEEVRRRVQGRDVQLELANDADSAGPGVVVRDAGNRQAWDNRLEARLDRLWPALRRELAAQTSLAERDSRPGRTA